MTSFTVLTKEELEQEVSPEEVDEQDACVGQEIKELNSPFSNFLKNLLCGGGRDRKARVESGEIGNSNFSFKISPLDSDHLKVT